MALSRFSILCPSESNNIKYLNAFFHDKLRTNFNLCFCLQISRPASMRKDGIQSRNRKAHSKGKRNKSEPHLDQCDEMQSQGANQFPSGVSAAHFYENLKAPYEIKSQFLGSQGNYVPTLSSSYQPHFLFQQ